MIEESTSSLWQLTPTSGGWAAAALAGLVGSGLAIRRRLSRDNTEIMKDKTESKLMVSLMDRAIAAEAALARRAEDLAVIARLQATNEHQQREIDRLKNEFHDFKRLMLRLYPDARQFLSTQQALGHVDPR